MGGSVGRRLGESIREVGRALRRLLCWVRRHEPIVFELASHRDGRAAFAVRACRRCDGEALRALLATADADPQDGAVWYGETVVAKKKGRTRRSGRVREGL